MKRDADSDYVKVASRNAARKAAKAAAADIEVMLAEKASRRGDSLPLYTWGSMAAVCVLSFFVIKLTPGLSGNGEYLLAQKSPTVETAKAEFAPHSPPTELVEDIIVAVEDDNRPEPDLVDDMAVGAINPQEPALVSRDLGVTLGAGADKKTLRKRMKSLRRRAPELFAGLEGSIVTTGEADLSVLNAGPFKSEQQRADFCRSVMLQLTVTCTVTELTQ